MKRFSLVVPTFNVERYLPRFLASLEAQTFDHERTEIILVDDGSTDGGGLRLDEWAAGQTSTRVVHRTNGGLSAARNSGLELAAGEWVLFPDPDDELPPTYLSKLDDFIVEHNESVFDVIAVSRVVRDERTGKLKNSHPLRGMFLQGDRVVALDARSSDFQLALNSGAVRRAALETTRIRFDERVRPTFEDAHLIGRLIIGRGTGLAICTGTEYLWTRRDSGDSVTQSSWSRPERYDDVFRFGYLDLLRTAINHLGHVPNWVARMVLYDLHWYVRIDRKQQSPMRRLDIATREQLEGHFRSVMDLVEIDHVADFDLCPDEETHAILRAFKEDEFFVVPDQSVALLNGRGQLEYLYRGPRPAETVMIGEESVPVVGVDEPVHFLGRSRLVRRRLEFPELRRDPGLSEVRLILAGASVSILRTTANEPVQSLIASRALRWLKSRAWLVSAHGRR